MQNKTSIYSECQSPTAIAWFTYCLPTANRQLRALEKGAFLTFEKRSYFKLCHLIWVSHLLAVSQARAFQLDLHQAISWDHL